MTKHTTREAIIEALTTTGGDITAAAELLGLRREAIHYRAKRDPEIRKTIDTIRHPEPERMETEDAESTDTTTGTEAEKRRQAAAVSRAMKDFIEIDGLPSRYADVFDYLRYLDEMARETP